MGPGSLQVPLAAALSAQAQVTQEWIDKPGVVGTAVGFGPYGRPVVKVYVTALGSALLPGRVAGIPISVELTEPFFSYADPPEGTTSPVDPKAGFPRPVPIGVSTGHPDITAGTIGARVTDGSQIFANYSAALWPHHPTLCPTLHLQPVHQSLCLLRFLIRQQDTAPNTDDRRSRERSHDPS